MPDVKSLPRLDEKRISLLAKAFAHGFVETNKKPIRLHIIDGDSPYRDLAKWVEYTVFAEQFGNSQDEVEDSFGAYDADSVFLLAFDHEKKLPAGMIRLIYWGEEGIPAMKVLTDGPWYIPDVSFLEKQKDYTVEIATWAVIKNYRRRQSLNIASLLLHGCVAYTKSHANKRVKRWIAIMDLVPLKIVQTYGSPFRIIPGTEPAMYLGSVCQPVYLDFTQSLRRLLVKQPIFYMVLSHGLLLNRKYHLFDKARKK